MNQRSTTTTGILYALGAYGAWGLAPLFWKNLGSIPTREILGHRVLWAMVVFLVLLALRGRVRELQAAYGSSRYRRAFLASAALIGINWYLFIWAVNHEHILQASLGYFVNPLFNVALGMIFLKERLRPWQWVSVGLASLGVLQMAVQGDEIPWVAISLVVTFGFYGLVRKTAPADALLGSNLETSFLLPLAVGYLVFLGVRGEAAFASADGRTLAFIAATGLMTALPLLWFSNAARRLPLSTLGFFQYLAPTGQFLLAVLVYDEPFTAVELRSFVVIWIALAVFSVEMSLFQRKARRERAGRGSKTA
jgi:chloramphenicol-sensitive protein RarD